MLTETHFILKMMKTYMRDPHSRFGPQLIIRNWVFFNALLVATRIRPPSRGATHCG